MRLGSENSGTGFPDAHSWTCRGRDSTVHHAGDIHIQTELYQCLLIRKICEWPPLPLQTVGTYFTSTAKQGTIFWNPYMWCSKSLILCNATQIAYTLKALNNRSANAYIHINILCVHTMFLKFIIWVSKTRWVSNRILLVPTMLGVHFLTEYIKLIFIYVPFIYSSC